MDHPGPYAIGAQEWPGLSKLTEEMGELQQVLGKLLGISGSLEHWDGNLGPRLIAEIGDVQAAIDFFLEQNETVISTSTRGVADAGYLIAVRRKAKLELFRQWHAEGDPR